MKIKVIEKLNAKRFKKNIYKTEWYFSATLSHYQVKSEKV